MSTLKVTTIQDTSGGNASTSEQIAQGRAKVWVCFTGNNVVGVLDSFNTSSITDVGTGVYTVNFSITLGNKNYCASMTASNTGAFFGAYAVDMGDSASAPNNRQTDSVHMFTGASNQLQDPAFVSVVIHGDD